MKKALILISSISVLIGGFVILNNSKNQNIDTVEISDTRDRLEEMSKPSDLFFFQRSYPDLTYDYKTANRVIDGINKDIAILASQKSNKSGVLSDWKLEGPTNIGGRINAIAVHPNNQDNIYVGTSSGGIFQSLDGGTNWLPISDHFSHLAISDITISESDPNIIYAATGDHNISGLPKVGNGVYKSIDGGQNWIHKGLSDQCIISKIIVHPLSSDTLYAAAMGIPFIRGNDRGVYKSIDGGDTWTQISFISDQAGAIDLVMDPYNPNVLYFSGWDRIRNNQESIVNGPGCKIWKTDDAGQNWSQLNTDLPNYTVGRIGLEVSRNNPNTVFAMITDTTHNLDGIYRSTNAGSNWTKLGTTGMDSTFLRSFGWYFGQVRVNPYNDNHISLLGVEMTTSFDGGLTWSQTVPLWSTYEVHGDEHDMIYLDSSQSILATDGGLYKSTNNMTTWSDVDDIPNCQIYRLALSPHNPGIYTAGLQDNGTTTGNASTINTWTRDFGGDGFQALFDPFDPNLIYYETQNGGLYYTDGFSLQFLVDGIDPADRRNWDMPFVMSKDDPAILYCGTYRVYKNAGAPFGSWYPISNDLTDGNIFGSAFHTISAISESPIEPQNIYAGTSDGNVWSTLDGGSSWNNISNTLPDRYVTSIVSSVNSSSTIFVSHSGYKDNDNTSHVHMSDDNGLNWTPIQGDLPPIAVNDILVQDYSNDSVIFAATDGGVFFTKNAGLNWERIGGNMPTIPVFDIEIDYTNNKLIAGTFARSVQSFSLDSILSNLVTNNIRELNQIDINIFPNPTPSEINISGLDNNSTIQIFNINGKLILSEVYTGRPINVSSLASGTFILRAKSEKGSASKRFVKE